MDLVRITKSKCSVIQNEQKVPVHLLEVGYSDCAYGYNKCWKCPTPRSHGHGTC